MADAHPIGIRGRAAAVLLGAGRVAAALSPVVVGAIASVAGGPDGWRWAFFVLALPLVPLAFVALRLPEPTRGGQEEVEANGDLLEDAEREPIPWSAAYTRLKQIRSFRVLLLALAAMGFGLFTVPVLQSLYLADRFGLDAWERGLVATVAGLGVLVLLPVVAPRFDTAFRRDPTAALRLVGVLLVPLGALLLFQYLLPGVALFTAIGVLSTALLFTSFTLVLPIAQAVVPPSLRARGLGLVMVYVGLLGGVGGGLLAAAFTEAFGPREAVLLVGVPATVLGGLLVVRGAGSIKSDLSRLVLDLRDEREEHLRQANRPDEVPAVQVSGVDFAYGPVQVLFDVGFEIRRGEVLALLGTNGAGKTTVTRLIAGLGTPSKGSIRLHGRQVTHVGPEQRVKLGVRLLPGGKGVFPHMTVRENLEMGAYLYRGDKADVERRIDRVFDLFPPLRDREEAMAASLSGGQQQMLALAITLLHDTDVLLIDELSLGLAPIVVQELLRVVERLKAEGITILIVEQSLNIALSVADRAVYLEKGHVRFEGPAEDLAARSDLAQAVFLGGEGS